MRLIDAEPIIKNLSAMKTQLGYDAIDIDGMIKALREAEEVTNSDSLNDPLTLEQMREMDGEPVWICDPDGSDEMWALVDLEYELCRTAKGGIAIFDTYGKTWLACRCKQEGG